MTQRLIERLDVSFLVSAGGVVLTTTREGLWGQVLAALCVKMLRPADRSASCSFCLCQSVHTWLVSS